MTRTNKYVFGVSAAAVGVSAALVALYPVVSPGAVQAVVLLCVLALVAELMSVVHSRSVSGSVAFIPYLAATIVAPSWAALLGVTVVRLLFERRRETVKALFNVSSHALTFALTVLFFRIIGGIPLQQLRGLSLMDISRAIGIQSIAAIMFSVALNSFLVSGVVAASSNKPLLATWRETHLSTIGIDVLAAPVIFVFAWVYVAFGAIAASTIWVPILGLRQVHKANLELEQTNRELLELMVKSIEARDPYTSGHSRRVHLYSIAIARSLGLAEKLIDRIGRAALLHDVGKIHEKYAPILRNPNRLTADEWTIMKEHPTDGARLVETVSGLKDLVGAIRGHHERWDGTGYPDGMSGESIPLESRIIMFADTIDAMTSERPYRPSLGEEQVRHEFIKARGTQFDPDLTDRILASTVWRALFPVSQAPVRTGGSLTLIGRDERTERGA